MAESEAESKYVFGNNCSIDNEDVEVHPYFSLYYPILDPTITFTNEEEIEPLECYSSTEAQSQDQDNSSLMRTSYLQKYAVPYGTQNYDVLSRQKNKNPTASTAVTTTKKSKQERKSNIKKTFPQKLGNQSKIQSRIPSTLSKGKKTKFFLLDHRIYPPSPRHPKNNSNIIHEINITASPSDIAKSKLADGATTHKQPPFSSQSLSKKSPARFSSSDSTNASNNLETSREGETFPPCRKISNHHMASKIPDATRTNRDSQEAICEKDATEIQAFPFHRSHSYEGINAIELTHGFWRLQRKKVTEAHKELERELFYSHVKWDIFFSTFKNDFPELSMLNKWYREKNQMYNFGRRVKRNLFGNKWYEEKKEKRKLQKKSKTSPGDLNAFQIPTVAIFRSQMTHRCGFNASGAGWSFRPCRTVNIMELLVIAANIFHPARSINFNKCPMALYRATTSQAVSQCSRFGLRALACDVPLHGIFTSRTYTPTGPVPEDYTPTTPTLLLIVLTVPAVPADAVSTPTLTLRFLYAPPTLELWGGGILFPSHTGNPYVVGDACIRNARKASAGTTDIETLAFKSNLSTYLGPLESYVRRQFDLQSVHILYACKPPVGPIQWPLSTK